MPEVSLEQLERILKLDRMIREGRARSTAQLARAFGISTPAVQRDLLALRDTYGAPLVVDRVQGYKYKEANWRLPTVPLTQGELFVLLVGNHMLAESEGALYIQDLQVALDQLVSQLPRTNWVDLQAVSDFAQLDGKVPANLNIEQWKTLGEALEKRLTLVITCTVAGLPEVYQIDPYLLHIYRGATPYLIGYSAGSKKIECLRTDRFQTLRPLGETFKPDPEFDPKPYVAQIAAVEAGHPTQTVQVRFTAGAAPTVQGHFWHPSQVLTKNPDGSLTLQLETADLASVKRWVLGYGAKAVVEAPTALAQEIRDEVKQLAKIYGTQ